MSGGGGDGGAKQARADEAARQARIAQGTEQINRTFDGWTDTTPTGKMNVSDLVDGRTYYKADKTPYTYKAPKVKVDSKNFNWLDAINALHEKSNAVAIPDLYASLETVNHPGTFSDEFYDKQYQNYLDYATPQLNDKYAEAQRNLVYALDKSGMTDSSIRAAKEAELQKQYDQSLRDISDKALSYKTESKSNVESARANLINTLTNTSNASQAANDAANQAKILSQPTSYSALGDIFSNFTKGLSTAGDAYSNALLTAKYGANNSGSQLYNSGSKSVATSGS